MGRKKYVLYIATVLLMGLIVLCGRLSVAEDAPYLAVEISSGGRTETIRLWENDTGDYLVFLPGYAGLREARLRTNAGGVYALEGKPVADGTSCDFLQENVAYRLTAGEETKQLTFVRSGGVPALYIDVSSKSMDSIHAQRGNSEPGSYRLYTAAGELDSGGNLESIQGRGNATWWTRDKKPYSLTLVGEADLLGMGRAKEWILLANSTEQSHVKNKAVLDLAAAAGMAYTPESQWVELYLNGDYAGLYLLCERNEIHSQRVAIGQENTFLVSMELESRMIDRQREYVRTRAAQALRIHQSYMDKEQLMQTLQSAENAILAEDGLDPVTGKSWQELIDLDSWARKYLLEEIFGNIDACSISQFFYYDGHKLYAGPAWDYDVTMTSYEPQTLFGCRPQANDNKPTPWFYRLCQKETFSSRVTELYEVEFRPLLAELLETGLDAYAGQIRHAVEMNLLRWPDIDPDTDRNRAKTYMEQRMAFLDSLWLNGEEYCLVFADFGIEQNAVYYAVRPGESLPALPWIENSDSVSYHGWYDRETGTPFDVTQPIYEDTEIYLNYTIAEEETFPEAQWQEPAVEEPLTMLRLGPVLLLTTLLVLAFTVDRFQSDRRRQKKQQRTGDTAAL